MTALLPRPVGRQKEVLALPASGHTVVLGTAGSGKTTLALHRAAYLSTATSTSGRGGQGCSTALTTRRRGWNSTRFEVRAGGIKLTVAHLATSTAFYEGLGLEAVKKTRRFVSFGAVSLVDAQTAVELSEGAVSEEEPNRRNRVELEVSNIEVAHRRIAEGGRQVQAILESSWGERSFHVLDPDGNLVEIVERRPAKESAWRR